MGTKKKFCNVSLYIALVISFFVCCITLLLTSRSYAMTESEVTEFLNYAKDFYSEKYGSSFSIDIFNRYYNYKTYFANYDSIAMTNTGTNNYFLAVYNKLENVGDLHLFYNSAGVYHIGLIANNPNYNGSFAGVSNNGTNFTYNTNYGVGYTSANVFGINYVVTNDILYNGIRGTTEYEGSNYLNTNNIVTNTISLTATSNHKFGFTSRNQLYVEFTGDWTTSDFTFYIQKLNGSNWETVTNYNDYSILTGYDNPYYIFWPDINYLPVGTYRFVADYGSLGTDLYYSNNFNITSSYVENETTGSITDNGDGSSTIDINIDTGNTVDDVKDFLGGPADISDLDINSDTIHEAIGLQNQVNPYDNFVSTFFTGLSGALTTVTPQQFKYQVHDWGPIRNVSVADITPQYSYGMASFLSTVSSLVVVFVIVKWTTSIIESLNTADVSRTLELVEEKYSDLF